MATITVILGDQQIGAYPIKHHPFTVGRDASCDVPIDNIGISRTHCRFLCEGSKFFVEDAGSSNGTSVNGEQIQKAEIKDGDEIQAGKFKLVFLCTTGEAAPPPKGDAPQIEPERPAAMSDQMKTFQMSAEEVRAKVAAGGPSVAGQRASDVAGGAKAEGVSNKAFYAMIVVFGVIVVALVVTVLVLAKG
ncbi:MAG: FHA domain-containing protein [Planctomycetota bacterium]|jgi:predicted component of type VI protein secretion system